MTNHAWGATAITVGAWETIALTTRRLPTVTCCVHGASRRWPVSRLLVAAWLAALGRHLLAR
jgi:hypothetical protein